MSKHKLHNAIYTFAYPIVEGSNGGVGVHGTATTVTLAVGQTATLNIYGRLDTFFKLRSVILRAWDSSNNTLIDMTNEDSLPLLSSITCKVYVDGKDGSKVLCDPIRATDLSPITSLSSSKRFNYLLPPRFNITLELTNTGSVGNRTLLVGGHLMGTALLRRKL